MKKGEYRKKNGFTIVEVSLVLAIAGLIFLMVFIALPALQRSQRDAQRRSDVLTFIEAVKKYQTNNRGALPEGSQFNKFGVGNDLSTRVGSKDIEEQLERNDISETSWLGLYKDYLGNNFEDPLGNHYGFQIIDCSKSATNNGDDCVSDGGSFGRGGIYGSLYVGEENSYVLYIFQQATCDGDKAVKTSNPRNIAVAYKLEGGGVYCANT